MSGSENFDAWELRALDRFATKHHVKEVEDKVDSVIVVATEQGKVLARLEPALTRLENVLTRILWAILTPVLSSVGAGIVWLIIQLGQRGGL